LTSILQDWRCSPSASGYRRSRPGAGYLLGPFGLGGKTGAWAFANLGVLVALAFGFVAHLVFGWAKVRAEEAGPLPTPATA
jgi:hypothetical protein